MSKVKNPDAELALHRTMVLIRRVEESLIKLFSDGEVPGFIHLSLGQEGVAAGVMSALRSGDTMATTHRGHGHVLARGLDLDLFFKEIMGRAGGICGGRGGSMHVADMRLGIIGANGIVGAGIPIALGSALGHSVQKRGNAAVVFFGDGAMAEGVLHETLNMASLWKLPLLLVCENNGWSEFSPTSQQFAAKLKDLAAAFGLAYDHVDGADVSAVARASQKAIQYIREGQGAYVLECSTHRVRGHYEGDPQKYRDPAELEAGAKLDPLVRSRTALQVAGVALEAIESIEHEVQLAVEAAIERARADRLPTFEEAFGDVYTASVEVAPERAAA
ncbi:thiamine pyrophosphate-dependent dehydrogenase E1 component subunit alpha [Cupriavidus nantongensis]|uniref:ABC transporter substrate-binding protein n=1 Tax=Cupriavidus nantongensis TaxID=1796606 RepID=A0A142JMC8_9BURK|nr:thiamine pyrophosphate-dependent dehydrogenase E1 component subunit alpha [Cupriavidus nantongensis]AMR79240.1 ABC transporter substrate-binding protein [Cupriavidus nantongensis]